MNFLYPGFLFALFSVIIPVVIHLFNFRKFKRVYFSNVDFLKEVEEQNSSREKLKNLLILLLRILAIAFLVLAFARPFLTSESKTTFNSNNSVSIYIDNSYSMDAVNKEGSLLDEAKRRAKEIAKAYQINDKFQLLTNDFESKHQRLLNLDEFLQALDEVKISAAGRNLQQVINRQEGVFAGNANRFSYIVSDFQEGFAGKEKLKIDKRTNVSLVKLNATVLPNVAIDSVWMLSPVHQAGLSEKLVVSIKNYGKEDAKNIPLKLTINNQQKAVGSVSIKAGATAVDTLSYSGLSYGWQEATLSIKDFPLTFDDDFLFTFKVSKNLNVLAINGLENSYLKTLFAVDPYFQLTEMSERNINYAVLGNYSLIVLNGLLSPSTGLAQSLKTYVNNGGSLVIFPNTDTEITLLSNFLTLLNLPQTTQLVTEPSNVSHIELKHPLLRDVFDDLPKNINLPTVNRYFSYSESGKSNKEAILQFPAGKSFLSRYGLGSGQIFLSATGLDEKDGNFSEHPIFVPLMLRVAFQSAQNMPMFYVLGSNNVITLPTVRLAANQTLKVSSADFEAIPDVTFNAGKTQLYLADQIKKTGFYTINKSDSSLATVAFNHSRTESNMNYDASDELNKIFGSHQSVHFIDTKTDNISSAVAEKNNGTELWKLCLILSLLFIGLEILLIRFFNPSNKYQFHEPLN